MSKKLMKAYKLLGEDTIKDLEALSPEELKQRVVQAEQAMAQADKELEENDEYQNLLESKKAMESGMKEICKRQKAVITVSLFQLSEKGTA